MQARAMIVTLSAMVALTAALSWTIATVQARQQFDEFSRSIVPVNVDETIQRVTVTQDRDKLGSFDAYATAETAHYVLVHDLRSLGCEAAIGGRATVDSRGMKRIEALRERVGAHAGMTGLAVRAAGPWKGLRDCARLTTSASGLFIDGGGTVVLIR